MVWSGSSLLRTVSFAMLMGVTIFISFHHAEATITGDAPPVQGDWEVDQDTTVTNELVELNGNLKLTNRATLTLDNVVLKLNSSHDGEFWVLVYPGTSLVASQTRLTHVGNFSYGIYFHSGSRVWMDESVIEYASGTGEQGPYLFSSNISITNSTLRENFNGAYLFARARLDNNTIYNNSVGLALMESYGSNDVAADNVFQRGPFNNQDANVRYHLGREVLIHTPSDDPVRNARIYLNDSTGRKWVEGGSSDDSGGLGQLYLAPWEITPGGSNRSLEPYHLSASRNGVANDSQYELTDNLTLSLELDLQPELSIDEAGIRWGQRISPVPSGLDNRTLYMWKTQGAGLVDPEWWYAMNFTQTAGWMTSPAPFGDTGNKNTNWKPNNQHGYFRHYFQLPEDIEVLSATLKVASKDLGACYVNGQLLFSDLGAENVHWQKYWNHEIAIPLELLEPGGKNYLACKVLVKPGNNKYTQFFDAEIEMQYAYDHPETLVNYHHGVMKVPVINNGTADVNGMVVQLYEEGVPITNTTVDIVAGTTRIVVLDWLALHAGQLNYTVSVDDPDRFNETDETDNEAASTIQVGDYEIEVVVVGEPHIAMRFDQTHDYLLNVTNRGEVNDTTHLSVTGVPTTWSAVLNRTVLTLEPGESQPVTLHVVPERGALQDNYSFRVQPTSSHALTVYEPWVRTGRDNRTPSRYQVFANREQIPSDWASRDFNDTDWDTGAAPFGNQDLSWSAVGTSWDTDDSYLISRKWFSFPDIPAVRGAQLRQAFTNYLLPYVNGYKLHNEWGGDNLAVDYYGYWYITTIPNWMLDLQGSNLLALRGRDFSNDNAPDNLMWLDYELTLMLGKYEAPETLTVQILPTRDFELADNELVEMQVTNTTVLYPLDMLNFGNVEQTIDLELAITHQTGNWTINFNLTEYTLNATRTVRLWVEVFAHPDLWVREGLNLTITATPRKVEQDTAVFHLNLTALLQGDELPPVTRVRHVGDWVRTSQVTLSWYTLDDTGDGAFYHLYFQAREPGGNLSAWQLYDIFDVGDTSTSFPVRDGYTYYIFSLGQDVIGNLEKNKAPAYDITFTVDLTPPASKLVVEGMGENQTNGLRNSTEIFLRWNRARVEVADDIARYSIEYRFRPSYGNRSWNQGANASGQGEGNQSYPDDQNNWSAWTVAEGLENTTVKNGWFQVADGRVYQLRSIAYDLAGWKENKSGHDVQVLIDQRPPDTRLVGLPEFTLGNTADLRLIFDDASQLQRLVIEYTSYQRDQTPSSFTWSELGSYENGSLPSNLTLTELEDRKHYLFRVFGHDRAGNQERRAGRQETFVGDGSPGQTYQLDRLPLPAQRMEYSSLSVLADTDNDGLGDLPLVQTMKPLAGEYEYRVDYANGTLNFGDGHNGYKPIFGYLLQVTYDAYDAWTVVDRTAPLPPGGFENYRLDREGRSVNLQWEASPSQDVMSYLVERSDSMVGPWTPVARVESPRLGDQVSVTLAGLVAQETVYYRVLCQDEAGHLSRANNPQRVEWQTEVPATSTTRGGEDLSLVLSIGVVALLVLVGAGATMYLTRRQTGFPPAADRPQPALEPVSMDGGGRQTITAAVLTEAEGEAVASVVTLGEEDEIAVVATTDKRIPDEVTSDGEEKAGALVMEDGDENIATVVLDEDEEGIATVVVAGAGPAIPVVPRKMRVGGQSPAKNAASNMATLECAACHARLEVPKLARRQEVVCQTCGTTVEVEL